MDSRSRQPSVILTARRRHTLAMLLFVAALALLAGLGTAEVCRGDGHGGFIYCPPDGGTCQDFVPNGTGGFTLCLNFDASRPCTGTESGTPFSGGGPGGGGPPPATPTPVPQALGGFSAGSWGGPTDGQNLPAAAYYYGILDASSDPSTTVSVICNAQNPGAITYTSNSITDTSKSFPPGAFAGGTIQLGNYLSARTMYSIIANDAQTITISGNWSSTPATDTPYLVLYLNNGVRQQTGGADLDSPRFGPGAVTLVNQADGLDAFWWLTSLEYAHNVCFYPGMTAQQWGATQALYAADAIYRALGNGESYVANVFADVEPNGVQATGDWTSGDSNAYRENQQVLLGFFTGVCSQFGGFCQNGVYVNPAGYKDILGLPAFNQIGTTQAWLADYGATGTTLSNNEDLFTSQGLNLYSWQYADNAISNPDPNTCLINYATAEASANAASPPIPRFDVWTNSDPSAVCP